MDINGLDRPAAQNHRLISIQYLRGLAASGVMWFHFASPAIFPVALLTWTGNLGQCGVEVFFMISGFVIPYSLGEHYRLRQDGFGFFLRRLVRIEPPYLVAAVVSLFIILVAAAAPGYQGQVDPHLWFSLALHPFYLVPWLPDARWLNVVFWTLAIEFQYYIVVLVVGAFIATQSRAVQRAVLALAISANLICWDERLVFAYLSFFLLGYIQYLKMRRGLTVVETIVWSAACFLVGWEHQSLSAAFLASAAAAAITLPWPRLPGLAFLGTISYSLYLLHWIIGVKIIHLATRLNSEIAMYGALGVAIVASLACATLFWWWVERPFTALSRQIHTTGLGAIRADRERSLAE